MFFRKKNISEITNREFDGLPRQLLNSLNTLIREDLKCTLRQSDRSLVSKVNLRLFLISY